MVLTKNPTLTPLPAKIQRFIGLDIHKHYLVAIGVDRAGNQILGPCRVKLKHLSQWISKQLTVEDAVVLESTTNAFQVYDELQPHVHTVAVVHPPHVALITRAQVMTDKLAALILARLYAKGLLVSIWVPPQPVRDLRALVAQRAKLVRLSTQAKNRLHAVLHRRHLAPPPGAPFAADQRDWWDHLPVAPLEQLRIQSDLDTLAFAQAQIARLEEQLATLAVQDERLPLLVQLPGVGWIVAVTLLAAIGDIARFPAAKKLVGYAGLGSRVHESGQSRRRGRITKAGRRDIRRVMIQAAHAAARYHPHWHAELARLEPRLGRNKAIVAIARKLLVAVWHVLTKRQADRYSQPEQIARKLLEHTYRLGRTNRPAGQRVASHVRAQMDVLGVGADLTTIRRSKTETLQLPASRLAVGNDAV
jgi:transposase